MSADLAAATSGDQVPEWVRAIADQVDLDQLRDVVVARDIAAAFPDLAGDEEFVERLRASVAENLLALQNVLGGRLALDDVRLTEPLVFATVQARLRVPQTSLQRSYRVGFLAMWQCWAGQLRRTAHRAGVPRDEALLALEQLTGTILAYQDHVASQVAESYARTDDALSRSRAHVRSGLVRQLLREDPEPLSPADQLTLGYPVGSAHVAVLLPAVAEGTAERMLQVLRAATWARQGLVYPVDLSSTVLWLGQPSGWTAEATAALTDRLVELHVEASVSDPATGLAGFRATWEQVREVEDVRRAWGPAEAPRVLRHRDVGLEILLVRDPVRARHFVATELGPLAEDTEHAQRLRETLEVSFDQGSHVATAAAMHLHEHTVRNRLQKAEGLLGRSLRLRRTELQVALRLVRLLGDEGKGR